LSISYFVEKNKPVLLTSMKIPNLFCQTCAAAIVEIIWRRRGGRFETGGKQIEWQLEKSHKHGQFSCTFPSAS
jgi:hypothetical protein